MMRTFRLNADCFFLLDSMVYGSSSMGFAKLARLLTCVLRLYNSEAEEPAQR